MHLSKSIYSIEKFDSALRLPEEWDIQATGYFQTREFLVYNEQFNPCKQRYYLAYDCEGAQAAAVVYTISVDLFTFSSIPSPIQMTVIGLPVSVSPQGIFGKKEAVEYLIAHLLKEEKGLITGLNLHPDTDTGTAIKLRMLPTLELSHNFKNWNDYLEQLRAPYRRRYRQISERWKAIQVERTSCSAFSELHYSLYLDVLNHSTTKLETLNLSYFKNLSGNFQLTTFFRNAEILSWHITYRDFLRNQFFFFFGGHNYRINLETNAYFNNLLGVLQEAIKTGFPIIDFGQTAEIPKMRLGGTIVPKVFFLYHSNPIALWILKKLKVLLEYKRPLIEPHVFKRPATLNQQTL